MAAGEINTLPFCGACGWDLNSNTNSDLICDACGQDASFSVTADTPPLATNASSGEPGEWLPVGSRPPADIGEAQGISPTVGPFPLGYWPSGFYNVCLNSDEIFWDGDQWLAGRSPIPEMNITSFVQPDPALADALMAVTVVTPIQEGGGGAETAQWQWGIDQSQRAGSLPPLNSTSIPYAQSLTAGKAGEGGYAFLMGNQYNTQPNEIISQIVPYVFSITGAPVAEVGNTDDSSIGWWTDAGGVPANAPSNAEIQSMTAEPPELWATGTFILTSDLDQYYWDGAAWQAGIAP